VTADESLLSDINVHISHNILDVAFGKRWVHLGAVLVVLALCVRLKSKQDLLMGIEISKCHLKASLKSSEILGF